MDFRAFFSQSILYDPSKVPTQLDDLSEKHSQQKLRSAVEYFFFKTTRLYLHVRLNKAIPVTLFIFI